MSLTTTQYKLFAKNVYKYTENEHSKHYLQMLMFEHIGKLACLIADAMVDNFNADSKSETFKVLGEILFVAALQTEFEKLPKSFEVGNEHLNTDDLPDFISMMVMSEGFLGDYAGRNFFNACVIIKIMGYSPVKVAEANIARLQKVTAPKSGLN